MPQTGSSLDADAISVYEAAMPGYEIFGVYSNSWINSDALHCRTHGVADREMLYIEHYPLYAALTFQTNFTVEADVVSYGGSPISNGFPKLIYQQNGGNWEEVLMQNTTGNSYSADIPGLSGSNDVAYYIYAENDNSKTESHPRIGAADPHLFSYSGGSAGTDDLVDTSFVNLYPNPSSTLVTLQTTLSFGTVSIYNTNGQQVYINSFNEATSTINLSGLTTGVYFVKVTGENRSITKKLVVE